MPSNTPLAVIASIENKISNIDKIIVDNENIFFITIHTPDLIIYNAYIHNMQNVYQLQVYSI